LSCAKDFAAAAQPQVLFGDTKSIVSLAQDLDPGPGGLTQRACI